MPFIVKVFLYLVATFAIGTSFGVGADLLIPKPQSEVIKPTATPTLTLSPTPVPQVKINQVTPTPYDPIVDCGSDWQKQKGITSKVKKSTCDSWIDCQMYGGVFRYPKDRCDSLISCQIGDKFIKVSNNEECKKYKAQIPQQGNTVNCQTQSGWQRMSQDDCTKAQNVWGSQIQNQQNDIQNAMRTLAGLDAESWGAKNLDQLDNIRERVRQVQSPNPSVQAYANQIISFIEIRIKQAQGN